MKLKMLNWRQTLGALLNGWQPAVNKLDVPLYDMYHTFSGFISMLLGSTELNKLKWKWHQKRFVLNGTLVKLSVPRVTATMRLDAGIVAYRDHTSLHMPVVVQFCWPCLQETAVWAADFLAAHLRKKCLARLHQIVICNQRYNQFSELSVIFLLKWPCEEKDG